MSKAGSRRLTSSLRPLATTGGSPVSSALSAPTVIRGLLDVSVGAAAAFLFVCLYLYQILKSAYALFGNPEDTHPQTVLRTLILGAIVVTVTVIGLCTQLAIKPQRATVALLRTAGATPFQIQRTIAGHAVFRSLISGIIGIGFVLVLGAFLKPDFRLHSADWELHYQQPWGPALISLVLITVAAGIAAIVPVLFPSIAPPARAIQAAGGARFKRLTARTVWGSAAIILGLEAITVGSQRWFTGADITFLVGVSLLLVGLFTASPALCNLTANILLWPAQLASSTNASLARSNLRGNWHRTAASADLVLTNSALLAATLTLLASVQGAAAEGFPLSVPTMRALLWLSAALAAITIVSGLASSALQRDKELARLRSLGMDRTEILSMVAWESLAISVYGIGVGGVTGVGLATALESFIRNTVVLPENLPWGQLILMSLVMVSVILATNVGCAAARTKAVPFLSVL